MLSKRGKLATRPDQISLTRPRERNCNILHNATGLGSEHKNAIGKIDRLVHVMRDEESRLWLESQNFRDITLQFLACNRIQSPKRLIHQKDIGIQRQRTRDADALLHPTGYFVRIELFVPSQSDEINHRLDVIFTA